MFKDYNSKFPPYELEKVSRRRADADKAAVFALIGTEGKTMKKTSDNNFNINESTAPKVLYPQKTPVWKRIVPAAAAAAVLAAAIPVGANVLGKRSEIANPSAASEQVVSAAAEPVISNEAAAAAFKEYFRDTFDNSRQHDLNPDAALVSDAYIDALTAYTRGLDISDSANGITVNVCGILNMGDHFYLAYDFETERNTTRVRSCAFSGLPHNGSQPEEIAGGTVEAADQKYAGLYVSEFNFLNIYYTDNMAALDKTPPCVIGFINSGEGEVFTTNRDYFDRGVTVELPSVANSIPRIMTAPTARENDLLVIDPFGVTVVTKDNHDISYSMTVTMKDSTTNYSIYTGGFGYGNSRETISVCRRFFTEPLDIDKISRVEWDALTIYTDDPVETANTTYFTDSGIGVGMVTYYDDGDRRHIKLTESALTSATVDGHVSIPDPHVIAIDVSKPYGEGIRVISEESDPEYIAKLREYCADRYDEPHKDVTPADYGLELGENEIGIWFDAIHLDEGSFEPDSRDVLYGYFGFGGKDDLNFTDDADIINEEPPLGKFEFDNNLYTNIRHISVPI